MRKKIFDLKGMRRRGGISMLAVFFMLLILLFSVFFLELLEMYDCQYAVEVRAQRAVNSTVEYAMDDVWRSDGFNVMDVSKAQSVLMSYLYQDLKLNASGACYDDGGKELYRCSFSNIVYSSGLNAQDTAGVQVDVTVNMKAGVGKWAGMNGYTWTNTFKSTNFRTNDDQRSGWLR